MRCLVHVRPSGFMFPVAKASSVGANKVNLEDHVPGLDSHPMAPPAPTASWTQLFQLQIRVRGSGGGPEKGGMKPSVKRGLLITDTCGG